MTKIDYSEILFLSEDGIHYNEEVLPYSNVLLDEKGFSGEQRYENGEFLLWIYSKENFVVSFSISKFGSGEFAKKSAYSECCRLSTYLELKGLKIQPL